MTREKSQKVDIGDARRSEVVHCKNCGNAVYARGLLGHWRLAHPGELVHNLSRTGKTTDGLKGHSTQKNEDVRRPNEFKRMSAADAALGKIDVTILSLKEEFENHMDWIESFLSEVDP